LTAYGDDHYFDKINDDNRLVIHWALRSGIEEVTDCFEKEKFVIEVFNSKVMDFIPHIDPNWEWPEPPELIDFSKPEPKPKPLGSWLGRPPFLVDSKQETDGLIGLDVRGHKGSFQFKDLLHLKKPEWPWQFVLTGKSEFQRASKSNVAQILYAAQHYVGDFDNVLHKELGFQTIQPKSLLKPDPFANQNPQTPTLPSRQSTTKP